MTASPLTSLIALLRPRQWTKNSLVFAAWFFAFGDRTQVVSLLALGRVAAAAALFCVVSSGVYVVNDLRDVAQDRHHPLKRYRPVAAGRTAVPAAVALAVCLLAGGLAGAAWLSRPFLNVVLTYVALQLTYTFWLKQVALVDTLVVASGFVLRALAGTVVLPVAPSPWLLLCAFFLALFLALCKRRHEKLLLDDLAEHHRPSLEQYDRQLLDQLIAVMSAVTILAYAIYTLWPETVHKFGTSRLAFTVPFVVFGIFRYLDLVYRREEGGHPEKVLLSDGPLLATVALYAASVLAVFWFRR
jgi:4-hydroxybenzoate polyprenyltransferase